MLAAFLPGLLLAPLAGVLVDRFDRCLMMILSDTLSAIGLVALLLAFHSGVREVWVICACVAFSSVFEALLDPAYRATVTDLLTPEQYARASGMTQLAAAAQYLISPAVAGLVMVQSGIDAVLMIDVATMVTTVSFTVVVWRTIKADPKPAEKGFWEDFRGGLVYFARNRGIVVLMLLVTLMTFCMGFLQTLLTPMTLDLTDEQTLGLVRSAAAIGMAVASLAIGVFNMGSNHIRYLAVALACGGRRRDRPRNDHQRAADRRHYLPVLHGPAATEHERRGAHPVVDSQRDPGQDLGFDGPGVPVRFPGRVLHRRPAGR